jgi:hypothetical protein
MAPVGDAEPRFPASNDRNPITEVAFVPIAALRDHGFSPTFSALAAADFPRLGAMGCFVGPLSRIGL